MCSLPSGKKLGYTFDNKNFHNVSLGQGQEVIAEQALDLAAKNGHWVILQVQYKHTHTTQAQTKASHCDIKYIVQQILICFHENAQTVILGRSNYSLGYLNDVKCMK